MVSFNSHINYWDENDEKTKTGNSHIGYLKSQLVNGGDDIQSQTPNP